MGRATKQFLGGATALLALLAMLAGGAGAAPRQVPIWVGYLRLSRTPTLGTVDPTRAARRAMWRESRRKFPGVSGRQFVKARKAAQRSVRT